MRSGPELWPNVFKFYPERLLNSRSGRIHLFPGVPAAAEIGFHAFQARGAFLVSAQKNREGVSFVQIEARRDESCLVMNPWPGKRVTVRDLQSAEKIAVEVDTSNGECLKFPALKGHRYRLGLQANDTTTIAALISVQ